MESINEMVRGMYKDMVQFLQTDLLLDQSDLQAKGERTFANDCLKDGGELKGLTNGVGYEEVREYTSRGQHRLRYYFLTKCYSVYSKRVILKQIGKQVIQPDIVIMNSCLWDISRYGVKSMKQYKQNFIIFLKKLRRFLPNALLIWLSALPVFISVSRTSKGGVMLKSAEWVRPILPGLIRDANRYCREKCPLYGVLYIDLYKHFYQLLHLRKVDGIHWCSVGHRIITEIIINHLKAFWFGTDKFNCLKLKMELSININEFKKQLNNYRYLPDDEEEEEEEDVDSFSNNDEYIPPLMDRDWRKIDVISLKRKQLSIEINNNNNHFDRNDNQVIIKEYETSVNNSHSDIEVQQVKQVFEQFKLLLAARKKRLKHFGWYNKNKRMKNDGGGGDNNDDDADQIQEYLNYMATLLIVSPQHSPSFNKDDNNVNEHMSFSDTCSDDNDENVSIPTSNEPCISIIPLYIDHYFPFQPLSDIVAVNQCIKENSFREYNNDDDFDRINLTSYIHSVDETFSKRNNKIKQNDLLSNNNNNFSFSFNQLNENEISNSISEHLATSDKIQSSLTNENNKNNVMSYIHCEQNELIRQNDIDDINRLQANSVIKRISQSPPPSFIKFKISDDALVMNNVATTTCFSVYKHNDSNDCLTINTAESLPSQHIGISDNSSETLLPSVEVQEIIT
ncbi:unnamed protein product, partial [Didymodactylos carnosus]